MVSEIPDHASFAWLVDAPLKAPDRSARAVTYAVGRQDNVPESPEDSERERASGTLAAPMSASFHGETEGIGGSGFNGTLFCGLGLLARLLHRATISDAAPSAGSQFHERADGLGYKTPRSTC